MSLSLFYSATRFVLLLLLLLAMAIALEWVSECIHTCVCGSAYGCVCTSLLLVLPLLFAHFAQSQPREHVCSHWCSLCAIISCRTGRCRKVEFALACVCVCALILASLSLSTFRVKYMWVSMCVCVCVCIMHVVDVWWVRYVCEHGLFSPDQYFRCCFFSLLLQRRYFSWQYVSRAATIETSFSFKASVQLFRRTFWLCPVCKFPFTDNQSAYPFCFWRFRNFVLNFHSIIHPEIVYGKFNFDSKSKFFFEKK